jgi:uncharacterized protein (TIGR00255 family)
MITSMTGFASVSREDALATVAVTLKSVNHRYLDLQVRAPQALAGLEPALRARVQALVTRGRVEMAVSLQLRKPPTLEVELNAPFVEALSSALEQARQAGLVSGTLAPGDLVRLPQALSIREQAAEADEAEAAAIASLVERTLIDAMASLDEMRRREGRSLRTDLDGRLRTLAAAIDEVAGEAQRGEDLLRERLSARVEELRGSVELDPAALAQEVVKFVSRSDISEELVRFRAHVDHWNELADGAEPCGRKLDFLLQEMNREINTIGSKAEGRRTGELVVTVKAELEKMREQVQNVE